MQMGRGKAPRCVFRLFREVIALPEGKSADLVTPRKARGPTTKRLNRLLTQPKIQDACQGITGKDGRWLVDVVCMELVNHLVLHARKRQR